MTLQTKLVELIKERSSVSSSEAAEALSMTRQTAHRHLSHLVRSGDLTSTGHGRATRYVLSLDVLLSETARVLDDAATDAAFLAGVVDPLRQRFTADDHLAPVAWAFDYMLLEPGERHEEHGPFGPMLEMAAGQYPRPLSEVPADAVSLWGQLSGLVTHPYLKARLHDLLWECRWSERPYRHAVSAIDAYVDLAPPVADRLEYADALGRAAGLARKISDHDRRRRVVEAALNHADMELASGSPKPGIVMRLLDVARRDRDEGIRRRFADLLQQAAVVFDDPWIQDQIIERQRAVSPAEQGEDLQRQSVDQWRRQASSVSGMKRLFYLTRALDHARTYGFREIADEIRQDIQELEFDEDEMQTVSGEVELPSDYIEETMTEICSAENWGNCLHQLMAFGPLSGSLRRNTETVHRQAAEFPLQRLATTVVRGPWNSTIFTASSEAERSEHELSRHETLAIKMNSYLVAEALDRIQVTHGNPTKGELQAFFSTPAIASETAERMAASVQHFTNGRFDECVMVLLPRIETTIREFLRRTGQPVWREPRPPKRPYGGLRPLRELLAQMKDQVDEDWRRYLITLLVNPLGPNLRNVYMHGLAPIGTRENAAALIHVAVYLTLARLVNPNVEDANTTVQP